MDYFKGVNDANEGLLRALDAYRNNIYGRPDRELKFNEALRRRKTLADIQKIQKLEDKPSLSGDAAEGGPQTAAPSLIAKAPAVNPALRGDEVFTTDPSLAPATGNLAPLALNEALGPMLSGRAATSSA